MYKTATLLLVVLTFSSCFELLPVGECTFLKEASNKKNSKKAILCLRDGNATADRSLHVTVMESEDEPEEREFGNTFTVDSDHNATRQDASSIGFTWLSEDTLQIDYDRKLRVFIQEKRVNDVTIVYKPRDGFHDMVPPTDAK